MSKIFTDNSQSIGNTPLVRLNHLVDDSKATRTQPGLLG